MDSDLDPSSGTPPKRASQPRRSKRVPPEAGPRHGFEVDCFAHGRASARSRAEEADPGSRGAAHRGARSSWSRNGDLHRARLARNGDEREGARSNGDAVDPHLGGVRLRARRSDALGGVVGHRDEGRRAIHARVAAVDELVGASHSETRRHRLFRQEVRPSLSDEASERTVARGFGAMRPANAALGHARPVGTRFDAHLFAGGRRSEPSRDSARSPAASRTDALRCNPESSLAPRAPRPRTEPAPCCRPPPPRWSRGGDATPVRRGSTDPKSYGFLARR